jgi:hypothetical protein
MQNLVILAFVIPSQVALALGEHAFTLWVTAKKARLSLSARAVPLNSIASKTAEKWRNFFGSFGC